MDVLKKNLLGFAFIVLGFFSFVSTADAAVLRAGPSQASVTAGNIINIEVSVDTLGKVINNAESIIQFPTDLLEVVSINRASSIFSLWVETPSFSNTAGHISFNGGIPNPGFQGSSGTIMSITFRAKKAGDASILFSNSAIRENDGLGTDILTGTVSSKITIRGAETPPTADTNFVVTSPTHPNQSAWYRDTEVQVSWTLPRGATAVRTLFDADSNSEPRIYYDSPITSRNITDIDDGIWYFHVQYLTSGTWYGTQHYKLQIDTEAPTALTVRSEKNEVGRVTIFMSAHDSLSGIDRFVVTVDSEKPITARASESGETALDVPFTRAGEHTLTVVAFDKADNKAETSIPITVDAVPELNINSYPTTLKVNESIEISGTAPYPFAPLQVSLKNSDEIVQVFELKSNSYSEFTFISQPITEAGTYTLWVNLLGSDDEAVLTSHQVTISVTTPLLLQIGSYTIGLMKVLIPAAVLLIIFVFITLYGWLRLFGLYRRVRKESREAEQVSNKAFKVLRNGVDRHIAQLKKAKRKLTKEEMEFLQEFSEKLKEAEVIVKKEIDDITKL